MTRCFCRILAINTNMAVFKKFLSSSKNKNKVKANLKLQEEEAAKHEEFESRKHEWQEDLDQMSEFLVLKSTEEQKEEGVELPVDTAYIEDRDGLPMLKATFDVHHFKPDEVQLSVHDEQLTLIAQCLEDHESAVFKKTMIRKIDLPKYVDYKLMQCDLTKDGILIVEMPFHLPPQHRPVGPSVVPIVSDGEGHRTIRLAFMIGPDFTMDDIRVDIEGQVLFVSAAYDAEIGVYGAQVTARELKKQFRLPDCVEVEKVDHMLTPDGKLYVDILLKSKQAYKCEVTTEDCSPSPSGSQTDVS